MSDDGAAQASVVAGAVESGAGSLTKSETGGGIAQERGRTRRHGCGSHSSLCASSGNEIDDCVRGCVCSLSHTAGGRRPLMLAGKIYQ